MNRKLVAFVTTGLGVGALTSVACIELVRMEAPRGPAQLPADLFKLHIHVEADPLTIEVPLPSLGTTTIPVTHAKTDPQSEYLELITAYEAAPAEHQDFADRNDYAAALLFAGRYKDAIPVLVKLEEDFPGRHATAANLGTAYELVGDLPNAATWIAKGVERSKESHNGTEWLHLAILTAKQKLKDDPGWLATHSVMDGQEGRTRLEKERALEYQLNERLYFIRSDDPVMCDLFYQAAITTSDFDKRQYFLKQVPRFGTVRNEAVARLRKTG